MKGIWIHDALTSRFSDYAPSLLSEWDALWWMIGIQTGPMDSSWLYEADENDAFYAAACVSELQGGPFDQLWKPNSLLTLAPYLLVDEWSYYCGVAAFDFETAARSAHNLNSNKIDELLTRAEGDAEIVIIDADDGLLFVFSKHQNWLNGLASRWKHVEPIDSLNCDGWLP